MRHLCTAATEFWLRHALIGLMALMMLSAASCKKDVPLQPHISTIQLSFMDASCTEAWLKISSGVVPASVALKRNGQIVSVFSLVTSDSTVVDESLLPGRTYTYQASRLAGMTEAETTSPVQLTTMDTTSHDFTWEMDTLGVTSSTLNDVAIVNDTLAYAVGEMYLRDSTGQIDPLLYNIAKWNGRNWQVSRVTVMFRGSPVTLALEGIFACSADNIWLAGSIPIHGDGVNWIGYDIQSLVGAGATVSRIWGTSLDMYFVGRAGNIIHYNGTGWQRVESATTLPINDIFGAANQQTGELQVLCIASDQFTDQGRRLLSVTGSTVRSLPDSGLSWALNTIWFVAGRKYMIGGDGLYISRTLGPVWFRNTAFPPYYKTSVRGEAINNIIVVGAFGLLMHYNGATWRNYQDVTLLPSGAFARVDVKGRLLIAVGGANNRAIALIGRR